MLSNIFEFSVELAYSFFLLFILLRFLLQIVKANFYHPIIQSIVKITNPIILPIRRITPIINAYDWSCILAILLLGIIKYVVFMSLGIITPLSPLALIGVVLLDILRYTVYIYLFAYILQAIGSWLGSSPRKTVFLSLLNMLTTPVNRKFPLKLEVGAVDFRPTVIILLLFIALRVINHFTAKLLFFF